MTALHPIFSYENHPGLLKELAKAAKIGMEEAPRNYKGLEQLIEFFQIPVSSFANTPSPESFRDRLGSYRRLVPLSERWIEKMIPVQTALENPKTEELKPLLAALSAAHNAFLVQYATEYRQACPYEPHTILECYPKTIGTFLKAIYSEVKKLSKAQYENWKEKVQERSEELLPVFTQLAIGYLIDHPYAEIPEIFEESDIANLRKEKDPKTSIARLASSIQYGSKRQTFNGVIRLVYEEAAKSFLILDQIDGKKRPKTAEDAFRIVFLALLRQPSLKAEDLPIDFTSKEKTLEAHKKYKALEKKKDFENLFLNRADDSDDNSIRDLLQDWPPIFYDWCDSIRFPLHELAFALAPQPSSD
ncbi:MAG: hypothetical protein K1X28_02490 [Parachlamydiales bacterium]|nr:hypothetical protein [Parachlamydiales bacterium]